MIVWIQIINIYKLLNIQIIHLYDCNYINKNSILEISALYIYTHEYKNIKYTKCLKGLLYSRYVSVHDYNTQNIHYPARTSPSNLHKSYF